MVAEVGPVQRAKPSQRKFYYAGDHKKNACVYWLNLLCRLARTQHRPTATVEIDAGYGRGYLNVYAYR